MTDGSGDVLPVLIVGAGPTGLALAVELARQGIAFRLIDKAAEPSSKSKALAVQARTLEFFERMGVVDVALARGFRFPGLNFHIDGKRRFRLDIEEIDSPFPFALALSQAETEAVLTAKLAEAGIAVERQVTLLGLADRGDSVEARLQRGDGGVEELRAGYLVGCDGAHSAVRHGLGLPFEGAAYEEEFMLADVRIDWSLPREGQGFIAGGHLLVAIPMADNYVRLIASRAERRSRDSDPTLADFQRLLDEMAGVPARISDPDWIAPFRLHRRLVPEFRVGRVFLAGDAAHIHSPAGGQGMNTGIQDACNLAWKLALVLRGQADERLLDSYHAERHPVAREVLRATDAMFKSVTLRNPVLRYLRNLILPLVANLPAAQARLRGFISEIALGYETTSPIVDEKLGAGGRFAGGPRPGARAPDASLRRSNGNERLFTLFDRNKHTLLLFAVFPDELAEAQRVVARAAIPMEILALGGDAARFADPDAIAARRYGVVGPSLYLIRPDGYVAFRAAPLDFGALGAFIERCYTT